MWTFIPLLATCTACMVDHTSIRLFMCATTGHCFTFIIRHNLLLCGSHNFEGTVADELMGKVERHWILCAAASEQRLLDIDASWVLNGVATLSFPTLSSLFLHWRFLCVHITVADPEGGCGGYNPPLIFKKKRSPTWPLWWIYIVVTSCWPDFLLDGLFSIARLNTNTLFAMVEHEMFSDIEVRRSTSVRSCS